MILNFVLLSSLLLASEARSRPKLDLFEIRENNNRRNDILIRPIYGKSDRDSELARLLFPSRKKDRFIDSESHSDESDVDDNTKNIIILSSLLEQQWNQNDEHNDHVFVDNTRTERAVDSRPEMVFQLVPKRNRVKKQRKLRVLRSQTIADDRTAAPRHKYNYDYKI